MKRSHARRRPDPLVAMLAILAMLCNVGFVIACDLHDLGHPAMAHGGVLAAPAQHHHDHDRACDPPRTIGAGSRAGVENGQGQGIDWHAVFHVGHGIVQALGPATMVAIDLPPGYRGASFAWPFGHMVAAPSSRILRPPIPA